MNKIKKIIDAHKFFTRESRMFVGKLQNKLFNDIVFGVNTQDTIQARKSLARQYSYPFKTLYYYPIAYTKFMWYSIKDIYKARTPSRTS